MITLPLFEDVQDFRPCPMPDEFYGSFGYRLILDGKREPKTGLEFERMIREHGGLPNA